MSKRKGITNDLGEVNVAVHQFGKDFKAISKQLEFIISLQWEKNYSIVEKQLPTFPDVDIPARTHKGQTMQRSEGSN